MGRFFLFLIVAAFGLLGWFRYDMGYFPWSSLTFRAQSFVERNAPRITGPLFNGDSAQVLAEVTKLHGELMRHQGEAGVRRRDQVGTAIGLCTVLMLGTEKKLDMERKQASRGGAPSHRPILIDYEAKWDIEARALQRNIDRMSSLLREQQKQAKEVSFAEAFAFWAQM